MVYGVESGTQVQEDEYRIFSSINSQQEIVHDTEKCRFTAVVFTVSALENRMQVVSSKIVLELVNGSFLSRFGDKLQVRDAAITLE